MKPAPPDPAETLHRVRQQLILAQVRIMELEDLRDEIAGKMGNAESLLVAAQTLADQKLDEARHLDKVRGDLQAQYEHMRHMQHITNEALNQTRAQADAGEQQRRQLELDIIKLQARIAQLSTTADSLDHTLRDTQNLAKDQSIQIARLENELKTIRATRSSRWTEWLRTLASKFGAGEP